ncbi:AraC family transcriptional regulator [Myxococcus stipitatus DSM 14675]|uniref:AraC family transcriptional regulator n=1 Tax=Myxococcus stipitatus (strain DSM 14675 / JCM 12634 / Mx s8) TaxID=1278073 RepID=L7UMD4_MYXSD|nr:AraC family transcriptional regulator [Myxococcus stipitatus]AGC48717.1 AraC family transcriptional regulator [Myxococcus stipitatus DSM 14675]
MRQKSDSLVQASGAKPGLDVLADVLQGIHLRSRVHARYELTAPWGMRIERAPFPVFYAVLRGNCVLSAGDKELSLTGGDFVFLPAGARFTLKDRRGSRVLPVEAIYATRQPVRCGGVLHYGGDGEAVTVLCGSFTFEGETLSPLVRHLPTLMHVKADDPASSRWLEPTLRFVASEIEAQQPGYDTVVSRLADVLFVQALRAHLESSSKDNGWLRALVDPRIGAVLQRVHEKPEAPWTLEGLARAASMSRSVFAERFKQLVGEPPLVYVGRWRMHRAMTLMRARDTSVAEVARAVGYETESAFGKAFRRWVGMTPGAFRRSSAATPSPGGTPAASPSPSRRAG